MSDLKECNIDGCQVHSYVMEIIGEIKERQRQMEDYIAQLTQSNIRLEESNKTISAILERMEKEGDTQDVTIRANEKLLIKVGAIISAIVFIVPVTISFLSWWHGTQ